MGPQDGVSLGKREKKEPQCSLEAEGRESQREGRGLGLGLLHKR